MFTLKGKLVSASAPKTALGKNKDGAARDFIVKEVDTEYPQKAKFNIYKSGDYAQYVTDKFPKKGSLVEVSFSLNLRDYQKGDKEYQIQELRAFKLQVINSNQGGGSPEDDDLPF